MEFGLRMLLLDTSFLPTGKGKLAQAELAAKRVVLRGRDAEENSNERVPYRPAPDRCRCRCRCRCRFRYRYRFRYRSSGVSARCGALGCVSARWGVG